MTAGRAGPLQGDVRVPGDKSISHRALILGLLTAGETRISGLLEGTDVLATARACRQLGALITRVGEGEWRVHGRGIGALSSPTNILDFENSGTSARLMMGAMATHPIAAHLTGDESLRRRPMERVLKPLADFGAVAHARGRACPFTSRAQSARCPSNTSCPSPPRR